MTPIRKILALLPLLLALATGGCAAHSRPGPPPATPAQIAELALAIRGLGPEVGAEEAERAARVAFAESRQLALDYGVTDRPLVHNMKVNLGLRERGLCWHWAEDLEARLREENFSTLELHRAIANADDPIRIDHSAVILSRRGATLFEGLVLDPWRGGGTLHWSPTLDDSYAWVPRDEVMEARRRRAAAREPALATP